MQSQSWHILSVVRRVVLVFPGCSVTLSIAIPPLAMTDTGSRGVPDTPYRGKKHAACSRSGGFTVPCRRGNCVPPAPWDPPLFWGHPPLPFVAVNTQLGRASLALLRAERRCFCVERGITWQQPATALAAHCLSGYNIWLDHQIRRHRAGLPWHRRLHDASGLLA